MSKGPASVSLVSNKEILESLHSKEEKRLHRFFRRRLRNKEEVADATQETFLRMLMVHRLTLLENPQAYLFQVAKSVAFKSNVKTARWAEVLDLEEDCFLSADDAPGQERIVAGRQALAVMARAISKLPNRCQQVFILSRLHGRNNTQIAEYLGISRNMVEKHIIKALLHCRKVRSELED
ncbi:MAG: sigma-70 family RNA polymerase sigma factor [Pseudomonadota bacterium]